MSQILIDHVSKVSEHNPRRLDGKTVNNLFFDGQTLYFSYVKHCYNVHSCSSPHPVLKGVHKQAAFPHHFLRIQRSQSSDRSCKSTAKVIQTEPPEVFQFRETIIEDIKSKVLQCRYWGQGRRSLQSEEHRSCSGAGKGRGSHHVRRGLQVRDDDHDEQCGRSSGQSVHGASWNCEPIYPNLSPVYVG